MITVGKNWGIGSDNLNIILYQRKVSKKTKKEYWRASYYFSNIKNALKGLVDQEVRDSDLTDVKSIAKKIDGLYDMIDKTLITHLSV